MKREREMTARQLEWMQVNLLCDAEFAEDSDERAVIPREAIGTLANELQKTARGVLALYQYEEPDSLHRAAAEWDASTNKWTLRPNLLDDKENFLQSVTLNDGSALIMRNVGRNQHFVCGIVQVDPHQFEPLDIPNPTGYNFSHLKSATALHDGRVFCIMSVIDADWELIFTILDLKTGTWQVIDNDEGEEDEDTHMKLYDEQRQITNGTPACITLPNGRILVTGGLHYGEHPISISYEYDVTTNTVMHWTHMTMGRNEHAICLLAGGNVFAAGGNKKKTQCEIYDTVQHTWRFAPDSRIMMQSETLCVALQNDVVFMAGETQNAEWTRFQQYDLKFQQLSGVQTPRTHINTMMLVPLY